MSEVAESTATAPEASPPPAPEAPSPAKSRQEARQGAHAAGEAYAARLAAAGVEVAVVAGVEVAVVGVVVAGVVVAVAGVEVEVVGVVVAVATDSRTISSGISGMIVDPRCLLSHSATAVTPSCQEPYVLVLPSSVLPTLPGFRVLTATPAVPKRESCSIIAIINLTSTE